MKWIYLIIAVIAETIATSALKESEGFTKVFPSILVILGYGLSFYFLGLTLKYMSIGIAYAIWAGLGIFLIAVIGYFRFHQKLDTPAMIGIALILIGVVVINVFSKSVSH